MMSSNKLIAEEIINGDIVNVLRGNGDLEILNIHSDLPTDTVLVLDEIEKHLFTGEVDFELIEEGLNKLFKDSVGTWLSLYYLLSIVNRHSYLFDKFIFAYSRGCEQFLKKYENELKNSFIYVGHNYKYGLWGDCSRVVRLINLNIRQEKIVINLNTTPSESMKINSEQPSYISKKGNEVDSEETNETEIKMLTFLFDDLSCLIEYQSENEHIISTRIERLVIFNYTDSYSQSNSRFNFQTIKEYNANINNRIRKTANLYPEWLTHDDMSNHYQLLAQTNDEQKEIRTRFYRIGFIGYTRNRIKKQLKAFKIDGKFSNLFDTSKKIEFEKLCSNYAYFEINLHWEMNLVGRSIICEYNTVDINEETSKYIMNFCKVRSIIIRSAVDEMVEDTDSAKFSVIKYNDSTTLKPLNEYRIPLPNYYVCIIRGDLLALTKLY